MSPIRSVASWFQDVATVWNRFWFTPQLPYTLSLIRILAGGMLFYTHLIWALDLPAFLGANSWVDGALIRDMHRGSGAWSYLWYIDALPVLYVLHGIALVVFAALTLGFQTRVSSVLAWLISLAYVHRLTGALFGLDQVNVMLAMYLAVGASGDAFSLDRWIKRRRDPLLADPPPRVSTNVAMRLTQLQLCVIYLFGGIGKMRGELWWDGSAVWYAASLLEYQSWDVTALVKTPFLLALITHVTVFWETFYCVLVWPRLTRPLMLGLAVLVHGGIALTLGMITFGVMMIIANMAFLDPAAVRRWCNRRMEGEPAVSTPQKKSLPRRGKQRR